MVNSEKRLFSAEAVKEKVIEVTAQQLNIDEARIGLESKFADDLGCDSLDTVELAMALEDEFGMSIASEDLDKLLTVGQAVDYIKSRLVRESRLSS